MDDLVQKAEAILAAAKAYKGDRQERYELMKKLDVMYLDLEDPVDGLMRQWTFVSFAVPNNPPLSRLPKDLLTVREFDANFPSYR